MKKLFFLLLTCSSLQLFAQDYKTAVETQFMHYTHALMQKDFKAALEYMNDDFFTFVSKEQMLLVMDKVYNSPEIEFKILNPQVLNVDTLYIIDGIYYVMLRYSNDLEMKFLDNSKIQDSMAKAEENSLTLKALQQEFGENNVKHVNEKDLFSIYSAKSVIANSRDLKSWKFIVVEEKQIPLLEKFIPKEILERVK